MNIKRPLVMAGLSFASSEIFVYMYLNKNIILCIFSVIIMAGVTLRATIPLMWGIKKKKIKAMTHDFCVIAFLIILFSILGISTGICGNRIIGEMKEEYDLPSNEGNFNMQRYYASEKCRFNLEDNYFCKRVMDFLDNLRNKMERVIDENLGECGSYDKGDLYNGSGGILKALITGNRNDISDLEKENIRISGLSHLFAISGLHISLLGYGLYALLRKKFGIISSAITSCIVIILYGLMIGFKVSTVRAIVMFLLKMGAEILGKTYDVINGIILAAVLVNIIYPCGYMGFSYKMSFAASIICNLIIPLIMEHLKVEGMVKSAFVFSMAVNMFLLPLVALYYYEIPLYAVLVNIIVAPFIGIVICFGIIGSLGLIIFDKVYIIYKMFYVLLTISGFLIDLGEKLFGLISKLPEASIVCGKPKLWQVLLWSIIVMVYIIVAIADLKYRWKEKIKTGDFNDYKDEKSVRIKKELVFTLVYISSCLVICFHSFAGCNEGSLFRSLFNGTPIKDLGNDKNKAACFVVDVGQGDFIFMRTGSGLNITIDGGSSSLRNVAKNRMVSFLKCKAVSTIDYAFITHGDEDHINGIKDIIENRDLYGIKVNNLVVGRVKVFDENTKELITIAESLGINVLFVKEGDVLNEFTCLSPNENKEYMDSNESSIVLAYESYDKKCSFLFTGDYSGDEKELVNGLNKYTDISKVTFLKVAHHGSKYESGISFLYSVRPEVSLISCGKNNVYGHPHKETLDRLEGVGSYIYRTDENGCITIRSVGGNISVSGYLCK